MTIKHTILGPLSCRNAAIRLATEGRAFLTRTLVNKGLHDVRHDLASDLRAEDFP